MGWEASRGTRQPTWALIFNILFPDLSPRTLHSVRFANFYEGLFRLLRLW